jgi:hypothetical protein
MVSVPRFCDPAEGNLASLTGPFDDNVIFK